MQLRLIAFGLIGVLALCTGTGALHAQEQRGAPALHLDPKLAVAAPTPGCTVDVDRLVARLRLELRQNTRQEPTAQMESYRGPLAASYIGPPVGFALAALSLDQETIAMPVLAGLLGLALPPIIHAAHGNSATAWYSVLGVVSSIAAGALLGAAIGELAPGPLANANAEDRMLAADARRDAREHGALTFAFVAYAVWALIDVAFFARVDASKVMLPHSSSGARMGSRAY